MSGNQTPQRRRIGLFGGSFDPVHLGHLALAHSALDDLALDELRWLPAGRPWQKGGLQASGEQRAEMLRLAIGDPQHGDARFRIETCEIERQGPTFTIDTVLALQQQQPGFDWLLLIGQDQHAKLQTWHRWRELLALVRLAVAVRPGATVAVDPEVAAFGFEALAMPPNPLSSTLLRKRVAAREPITDLVPAAVAGYIDSNRLYRGTAS
ncbi:nicotinate-nucleotide adenylyltransferase [Piscinibacter sakaiensis]|uniref:nicotinate-nucleotide adenylyltransferase n=1 Tax=Piscinibacter sakaiensis TaxID=1547922 RepID=UPI003AAF85D6